jgi:hypothetical protein
MEITATDEAIKIGLLFYIIIGILIDIVGTYYLLKKYEKKVGFEKSLGMERSLTPKFIYKKLGFFWGSLIGAIYALIFNTILVITTPIWLSGFILGNYAQIVASHYSHYKDLKEEEKNDKLIKELKLEGIEWKHGNGQSNL